MVPLHLLAASALVVSAAGDFEVLCFTSRNCGPCQQMSPIVARLTRSGHVIRKVDMDRQPPEAARFGVTSMPTFLLVVDGHEVDRVVGQTSEQSLKTLCERGARLTAARTAEKPPRAAPRHADVDLGEAAELPNTPAALKTDMSAGEEPPIRDRGAPRKQNLPAAGEVSAIRGQEENAAAEPGQAVAPGTPLASTVRLRITDAQGENIGTGTIIDSRPGRALILTCGHIFRNWNKSSQVQVDLLHGRRRRTVVGSKLASDLEADVGLVSIPIDELLPAARVAPAGTRILRGAPVVSVGCSRGDDPTVQPQKVTALNRYVGADNIECSVVPVQGRSGGGLFDRRGQVIGVCMAADPSHSEGLYAGLKAIHLLLERNQLAAVFADDGESRIAALPQEVTLEQPSDADPGAAEPLDRPRQRLRNAPAAELPAAGQRAPRVERDEVVGAEVVIIIHPHGKPGAPSKVVRLHRASRGFWESLVPELDSDLAIQETSMTQPAREAPRPATPRAARRVPAAEQEVDDAPLRPYRRRAHLQG